MDTDSQWQTLMEHFDVETWTAPIKVSTSLWFVQKITDSSGIAEYHPQSDSIVDIIDYPAAFGSISRNKCVVSCKYKEDSIVVLRYSAGCGFVFNTKTREFNNLFTFQHGKKTSIFVSCVSIGDYIHIFHSHGLRRWNFDYTICSMIDKNARYFEESVIDPLLQNEGGSDVIKLDECYQSANKMLISGFIRSQNGRDSPSVIVSLISNFAIFEVF